MDSFTATTKILENLNKKYKHLDNMMNLTKDLERAMMADDSVSFGRVLDMRGDVILLVDELDLENREIVSRLPEGLRERLSAMIMPKKTQSGESLTLDNPLETNIYDTNRRIGMLLSKIIKLDQEINQRVKGANQPRRLGNMRG